MQYSKQFAYLQCKIENINIKTTTCDCEKSDESVNKDGRQAPHNKNHVHPSMDEYYLINKARDYLVEIIDHAVFLNADVLFCSAYRNNIFHPPQRYLLFFI